MYCPSLVIQDFCQMMKCSSFIIHLQFMKRIFTCCHILVIIIISVYCYMCPSHPGFHTSPLICLYGARCERTLVFEIVSA